MFLRKETKHVAPTELAARRGNDRVLQTCRSYGANIIIDDLGNVSTIKKGA